jgi:hypothetical protein
VGGEAGGINLNLTFFCHRGEREREREREIDRERKRKSFYTCKAWVAQLVDSYFCEYTYTV